jgi:hypothetical protein
MASLEDQIAAEDAPSWNPYKDPSHDKFVKGRLLKVSTYHGDYGESKIHTVDRGEDSPNANPPGRFVNFFAFGAVADGEVREKNAREGERIAWLFKGTDTVKQGANAGKEYPLFRLFIERDGDNDSASPAPESDIPSDDPPPGGAPGAGAGDDIPFDASRI